MTQALLTTKRLGLRVPDHDDLPDHAAFYAVSDVEAGGFRGGRSTDDTVLGGTGPAHPNDWPAHQSTGWLMPVVHGLDNASETCSALIAWACRTLGWRRMETHMHDENTHASFLGSHVDRRQSFPDGTSRDVVVLPETGTP